MNMKTLHLGLFFFFICLLACYPTCVDGRDIPLRLRSFYREVKRSGCRMPLATGFKDGHGHSGFTYCGDYSKRGIIYISGPRSHRLLADMDVDCDGANNTVGRCGNDPSGQGETAFKNIAQSYGIPDLNANIHSYIVFGNEGAVPSFNPRAHGMRPLSVMAVICNNQLFYGVWGDTNGGVDTGEASISLATACFPNGNITADNGHQAHDVLYLGFTGSSAVPGKKGARWTAGDFEDFEASLARIGDKLVRKRVPRKRCVGIWKCEKCRICF
ncbi:CAZyme family GH75 [Paecilomyces variotii]|nr:CAZyme family GH75 [Paecilomyces variotii]KAJ9221935.1 CAZyme family GH75 [Paecilomyces variotii]KAJ9247972.1 CAZyme family GH75 [Paecilomyces variotii]KAJ9274776.1 CAZyme family GH75 [Paecilomyces variotii]KAJ9341290.1 CAZyme family GH75 [Paecilomyces variotii]